MTLLKILVPLSSKSLLSVCMRPPPCTVFLNGGVRRPKGVRLNTQGGKGRSRKVLTFRSETMRLKAWRKKAPPLEKRRSPYRRISNSGHPAQLGNPGARETMAATYPSYELHQQLAARGRDGAAPYHAFGAGAPGQLHCQHHLPPLAPLGLALGHAGAGPHAGQGSLRNVHDLLQLALANGGLPPSTAHLPLHTQALLCGQHALPAGLAPVAAHAVGAAPHAHAVPHLALASADGEWSVWDTRVRYDRGEEPTELARAKGMPFVAVALSPLGKRLVGGTSTELCIFDVRRGQILEQIPTGHYGICAISFSLDGTRLLSGGREDRRLRLWRMEDRSGAI